MDLRHLRAWLTSWSKSRSERAIASIHEVFHPGIYATGSQFVGRADLVETVSETLDQPGVQIFIHGPSGSGKTSVALRVVEGMRHDHLCLPESVTGRCAVSAQDFLDKLWCLATGAPRGETHRSLTQSEESTFGAPMGPLQLGLSAGRRFESQHTAPQLVDTESVAVALHKRGSIIVLDDLEYLGLSARPVLADLLKKMSDLQTEYRGGARLICVAATSDPSAFLSGNEGARRRTDIYRIPLFTPLELNAVSTRGFGLLRLPYDKASLRRIHYHSCGIPAALHSICRRVAQRAMQESDEVTVQNAIRGDSPRHIKKHVQNAINDLHGSGTLSMYIQDAGRKIAAACGSEDPSLQVSYLDVAISAAIQIPDLFSASELETVLPRRTSDRIDLNVCLTRLIEVGVLEYALHDTDRSQRYYRFPEHALRLGYRFHVKDEEIVKVARASKRFKRGYDQLVP